MKLPVSQLSHQDLARLFEQSSLADQYFFPREVPRLFPIETSPLLSKEQDEKKHHDESVEKN